MLPILDSVLLPAIVKALRDHTSVVKQEAAVKALGQVRVFCFFLKDKPFPPFFLSFWLQKARGRVVRFFRGKESTARKKYPLRYVSRKVLQYEAYVEVQTVTLQLCV